MDNKLKEIQDDIKNHKVILYMKGSKAFPMCGFSARVVEVLKSLDIPFETRNVLEDPILRTAIKEFSSWPTLPQLYIDGEFIGGCDIVMQLHSSGELNKLVETC